MTQQIIDTGEVPNDGSGDPLRLAFDKINNNFANLFALAPAASIELVDPSQFPDDSSNSSNSNFSGNITINANNIYLGSSVPAIQEDPTALMLTFTQPIGPYYNQEYINVGATPNDGTGDPLRTAFEKINNNFSNGNVRLMVNPIVDQVLLHFISAQITFIGDTENGLNIALDGYTDSVMDTEDEFEITTEAS